MYFYVLPSVEFLSILAKAVFCCLGAECMKAVVMCYFPGILVPTACVEDLKHTLTRIALQAAGTSENPMEV